MRYLIIPLMMLLLFTDRSTAQDSSLVKNHFEVHFTPSTLIDFTPRFRFGAGYTFGKMGICLDYGVGNADLNSARLVSTNWESQYNFKEVRLEMKYFLNTMSQEDEVYTYCGLEAFHMEAKDVRTYDYFYQGVEENYVYFDRADFKKSKSGVNLKLGIELIALKKVLFDFYGGLGVGYRDVSYTNVEQPQPDPYGYFGYDYYNDDWPSANRNAGGSLILTGTLGVKIGFIFWTE